MEIQKEGVNQKLMALNWRFWHLPKAIFFSTNQKRRENRIEITNPYFGRGF